MREGYCSPTSIYGWMVQCGIGIAVLCVLSLKWRFEKPRRRLVVFGIDCAKQVVGSGVIHFTKVFFSKVLEGVSEQVDECHDSSCLWYLTQSCLQPLFIVPTSALLLVRVSRVAPFFFIFSNNSDVYIQQYAVYFKTSREAPR